LGLGYPGVTLAGGQRTSVLDLATVNLNPFDPSLAYPGVVNFTLEAISPTTGGLLTANADSIRVQTAVPEPSALLLLASGLLTCFVATRFKFRV
jgi:PEP-CTERM motif